MLVFHVHFSTLKYSPPIQVASRTWLLGTTSHNFHRMVALPFIVTDSDFSISWCLGNRGIADCDRGQPGSGHRVELLQGGGLRNIQIDDLSLLVLHFGGLGVRGFDGRR